MGWKQASAVGSREKVRAFGNALGRAALDLYASPPHRFLPVLLDGTKTVTLIHYSELEVFEPDPPEVEYRETSYYRDTQTGTLYYISGGDAISITHISASISTTSVKANPSRYKRLFMEV